MYDDVAVEKGVWADGLCTVDYLRWDSEGAWWDVFAEGADCAKGENGADAEVLERGDVGARGDVRGRDDVSWAVTC